MTNTSPHMSLLNQLLGRVLRSADPTLLLLLSRWSDSWKKARVNKAETDANVQLIEDVANAKSQLIKDVTKSMSQMIAKAQADELRTNSGAIESDDISNMIEFQIKKKVANLIAIVKHAAKELEGLLDIPNHDPNSAWTNRWVDGAQDVSSEDLQKLWGKILAGEVKSPRQTSLRTLSILRDMTQQEARDFSTLMRFRISNFILGDALQRVLGQDSNSFVLHFSNIGLLGTLGETSNITLGDDGKSWIAEHYFSQTSWLDAIQDSPSITPGGYGKWQIAEHYGHILIIEGQPGSSLGSVVSVELNTFLITTAGLELAKFCQHDPDFLYLSHFASYLARLNCKLKIAKIVSQDAEDYQTCDEQVIKPFGEPEERNQEESNNGE